MDINNLRHPSAILKMVELLLLIIIMALFFSHAINIIEWDYFVSSVFIGCFINAIIFLANIFMGYDQYQKTPLELIISSYYLLSLFISGILLFTAGKGAWIACGIFCLILTVVYAAEVYLSYTNLVGVPVSFPAMPQSAAPPNISQNHPSVFPAEPYPPPPTYPNSTPMQQVDLGNPFDESRLQQL